MSERGSLSGPTMLAYGALVSVVAWAEVVGLLWWYVPEHARLWAYLGIPLPAPARVTVGVSVWTVRMTPVVIVSVVLLLPVFVGVARIVVGRAARSAHGRAAVTAGLRLLSVTATVCAAWILWSVESVAWPSV
jgi:type II secretory pathway component PulF